MYFVSLVQWLIEQSSGKTSGWNQYDDPGSVTNSIIIDLKKMGIALNFPATKLKAGSGDAVCQALLDLSAHALSKQKFKFKKPIVPEDDGEEEGPGGEDEMDGGADLAEMIQNFDDNDDIAELVEEEMPQP